MLRREGNADSRCRRLKEMQDAIAKRKEARQFVIQEKRRVSELHDVRDDVNPTGAMNRTKYVVQHTKMRLAFNTTPWS